MSHIFISYSRKDVDFAQKIVDALADNKLDTWIDWKSIPKGEDWEQEIYHGIEEADAFLILDQSRFGCFRDVQQGNCARRQEWQADFPDFHRGCGKQGNLWSYREISSHGTEGRNKSAQFHHLPPGKG